MCIRDRFYSLGATATVCFYACRFTRFFYCNSCFCLSVCHYYCIWAKLPDSNKCMYVFWFYVWSMISYVIYSSHPAFAPQPQSFIALWPVLIFCRPAEGRRLSWPGWLMICRDRIPAKRSPMHLSTERVRRRVTSLIRPTPLPTTAYNKVAVIAREISMQWQQSSLSYHRPIERVYATPSK